MTGGSEKGAHAIVLRDALTHITYRRAVGPKGELWPRFHRKR